MGAMNVGEMISCAFNYILIFEISFLLLMLMIFEIDSLLLMNSFYECRDL
jgi:hypothetical protein